MGRCERVTKGDGSSARVFHMPGRGGKAQKDRCEGCSKKRCCENCAYVIRPGSHWLRIILARWAGLLLCLNRADCPGAISETQAGAVCRNFRPRMQWSERSEPPESPNDKVRYIPLTKNMFAMVDAEDFEELSKYKWHAHHAGSTFYAARRAGGKTLTMHRVIMKAPKGMVVDHIDGNGLNNCKSNLRICTHAQNIWNSRGGRGVCGYKGVQRIKRNKTTEYIGIVYHLGENYRTGTFATVVEAALARDRLALALEGEHAYLNFPTGVAPKPESPDDPVFKGRRL
jgi:hypothetical protein